MKRQVYEQLHRGLGEAEFESQRLILESFGRGDFKEGVSRSSRSGHRTSRACRSTRNEHSMIDAETATELASTDHRGRANEAADQADLAAAP